MIRAAKTTILAAIMGTLRGTASRDARITPVEYSVEMTSTPSTQMASWPKLTPAARMTPAGSTVSVARRPGGSVFHEWLKTSVSAKVSPMVTTTKATRHHTVERTDRIFV